MQRVLVLGSSGSGKSTFTRALGALTGLPTVSLDALFWQPGWVESDERAFGERMAAEAEKPRWIMDGNYLSFGAGPLRLARADTVYWFDLPTAVCLSSVVLRILASYGKVRPEMAPGCPEKIDWTFLDYVRTYRARQRPKVVAALATLRPDQRFVRFGHRSEARAEFARLSARPVLQPA